jgi:threonine/homoserine/homoserine lactone efflux protein
MAAGFLAVVVPVMAGVILAQATPGPNMMAVAAVSLGSGRSAGLLTVAGIATGSLIWASLFAFGAGALLAAFPELVTAMKFLGGGYLCFLAVRALRSALRGSPMATATERVKRSPLRAYATGLAVVLTNPKAALMWIAIALFLASSGVTAAGEYLVIGVLVAGSALAVYGSYAVLFSTGVALRAYGRSFRWVEGLFGAVFGALGGKLVADGIADIARR